MAYLRRYYLNIALIAVLGMQLFFWSRTNHIKPDMIIVPEPPTKIGVALQSLGDDQFYFRQVAFKIQNAGDSWGRFTALKLYNYSKLEQWFYLLDSLDSISNFVPSLASYYYAQTQNKADTIHIVNYLSQHARKDMRKKWWWMAQAVYVANHRLGNKELALKLAYELAQDTPYDEDIPMWARQMPAFLHEKLGETAAAKKIIIDLLENFDTFTEGELNFMEYFMRDRLQDKKFRSEIIEELRRRHKSESEKQK
jgi:hypothetical protein